MTQFSVRVFKVNGDIYLNHKDLIRTINDYLKELNDEQVRAVRALLHAVREMGE